MFKSAFLAVVLGCAVAQREPERRFPGMNMPNIPFVPPGCDLQSLQSCLKPILASPLMQRSADMSLSPSIMKPDLDQNCRLVTELMQCVLPKMSSCGAELTHLASAIADVVNYMCVEAKTETQKYMNCLLRDNNAVKVSQCSLTLMQEETSLLATMQDPQQLYARFCGIMERFEKCAERKAGSLCNEEAYLKQVFERLNRGLSFMHCKGLTNKRISDTTPVPMPRLPVEKDEVHGERSSIWNGHMSEMQETMMCMQKQVMSCISPRMALFFQDQSADTLTAGTLCREFGTLEVCLTRVEGNCGPKAREMVESMKRIYHYLCSENRKAFEETFSCLKSMAGMTSTFDRCTRSLNSMDTRSVFGFDKQPQSLEMQTVMCRAFWSFSSCMSGAVGRKCGYKARRLIGGLQNEMYEIMEMQTGVSCPSKIGRLVVDDMPDEHFYRHRVLKIVLPVAGAVFILIIVAIVVAVKRRGATRRQTQEKADLVKNDLLQENLRFSIKQAPNEKSEIGGLKV